ncbi:MAG: hypothetical protein KA271_07335 [Propionivibrio sp.]|nr:hypothetical protein [Propionivibrio sp.]
MTSNRRGMPRLPIDRKSVSRPLLVRYVVIACMIRVRTRFVPQNHQSKRLWLERSMVVDVRWMRASPRRSGRIAPGTRNIPSRLSCQRGDQDIMIKAWRTRLRR